jgi:hypothetical protein
MRSLPLVSFFINLADVFLYILLGEKWFRRTKQGEQLINLFESGIANWIHTRANASLREEVLALEKFFVWSFLGLAVVAIILGHFNLNFPDLRRSLQYTMLVAIFGFVSLDWTFHAGYKLRSFLGLREIVIIILSCVLTFFVAKSVMTEVLLHIFQNAGWGVPSDALLTAIFIVFLIISLIFMLFFGYLSLWVVFGGLSFVIVGLIYVASLLSRFMVKKVSRDLAWQFLFALSILIRCLKNFLL